MQFFKNIIRKAAVRIYLIGKNNFDKNEYLNRINALKSTATFDETAFFNENTIIQNGLKDCNKIRIGKHSRVLGHLMLFGHGGEIIIGDYSFIGKDSRIWSAKKITIGDRVLISHNVNIHDNISHPLNSKLRHLDFVHIFSKGLQKQNDLREKEIIIEDDVWIGFNATILKGVKIGKGAIIGANTFISSDVPAFSVVVGNPSKIIKTTD